VLWAGGAAVSPELAALAGRAPSLWRVDDRGRRPPELGTPACIVASPAVVGAAIAGTHRGHEHPRTALFDALSRFDAAADLVLRGELEESGGLDEPRVAAWAAFSAVTHGAALFLGNSMPVRDVDLFAGGRLPTRVVANRGASGIDGLLSTAAGYALAAGPTLLLVGDVSFLHDAGSLSALAGFGLRLRVVVVDNRGGGIFDFLPIAGHAALMPFFTTPHSVDLVALAAAYGVRARRVEDPRQLARALAAPVDGLDVIVVPVAQAGPGGANVARHRAIYGRVREAAQGAP
jgi:2-succinyl-5-enolpyruvyl-6-hydroxy-3-cyclohexene-1-carboxylate synthase